MATSPGPGLSKLLWHSSQTPACPDPAPSPLTEPPLPRLLRLPLPAALLTACLSYEPPPPPPPPPGAPQPGEEMSFIPPGAAVEVAGTRSSSKITAIDIEPTNATTSDDLRASATVKNAEVVDLRVRYTWILNGQERPDLSGPVLSSRHTKKGDLVAVKATVDDGQREVSEQTGALKIRNSPPEFEKDPRGVGNPHGHVVRARDADGDPLRYRLEGAPAGMRIDPTSGRIEYQGSETEKGGTYQVSVIVEDGDGGKATWTFSTTVTPGMTAEESKARALAEQEASRKRALGQ